VTMTPLRLGPIATLADSPPVLAATPYLLLDVSAAVARFTTIAGAFGTDAGRYPTKANPHPALITALFRVGIRYAAYRELQTQGLRPWLLDIGGGLPSAPGLREIVVEGYSGMVETLGEAIRYRPTTDRDDDPRGPVVLAGPTCDSVDVSTVGFNGFAPLPTVLT